jgi:hypothetical protein
LAGQYGKALPMPLLPVGVDAAVQHSLCQRLYCRR